MNRTLKMTATAMLIAIGTTTSHLFYIPIGIAKVFPMQHFINVLSGVLLGPTYAMLQSFATSLLRNMMGTGSIFAFPGSMIGAFLSAFLFMKTKKIGMAFAGEVVGTGILGAMACYPIATLFLGKEATIFGFIPSFIFSSFVGAILGFILLSFVLKNPALQSFHQNNFNSLK